jgi:mono/diheme cytochrome c family protein
MSRFLGVVAAASLLLASAAASAQQTANRGSAAAGRQLALDKCDGCHIVAAHQEFPPLIGNVAPSFFVVANRPDTTAQSLQTFLSHPHTYNNMPYPDLTAADVGDVSAYILSLRGRH